MLKMNVEHYKLASYCAITHIGTYKHCIALFFHSIYKKYKIF